MNARRNLGIALGLLLGNQAFAQDDDPGQFMPARLRGATKLTFVEFPDQPFEVGSDVTLEVLLREANGSQQPVDNRLVRLSVDGVELGQQRTGTAGPGRARFSFQANRVDRLKVKAIFRGGRRYHGDETRVRTIDVKAIPVDAFVVCAEMRTVIINNKAMAYYKPIVRAVHARTGAPLGGVGILFRLEDFASDSQCSGVREDSGFTDECGDFQSAFPVSSNCVGSIAHIELELFEDQPDYILAYPDNELKVKVAACSCNLSGLCPKPLRRDQVCSLDVNDDDNDD